YEIDQGRHDTAQNHHQHGQVLVHSLEQPVKRQGEKNKNDRSGQFAQHAQAEEPFMRGDVACRRGCVIVHKQFVGNVDQAQWTAKDEEQVPESGDSGVPFGGSHGALLARVSGCGWKIRRSAMRSSHPGGSKIAAMNQREEFLRYFQSVFAGMVDRIPAMTETEVLDGLRELQAARNIYHEELVERFKTMTEAEAPGGEVKAAPSTTSLGFFVASFIRN